MTSGGPPSTTTTAPQPPTTATSNTTTTTHHDDFHYDTFKLPPELEQQISTIFQSKDPLDSAEFDPVDYINMVFPNEQSLASVDKVLNKLRHKMNKMDREVRELIRAQTDAGKNTVHDVEVARKAIQELFNKIQNIKNKSRESESMVHEITKDIKSLDYAKKNLTVSITMLRRLKMLSTAVTLLKTMAAKKQYRDVAQILYAIQQQLVHFKNYKSIRQVAELADQVHLIQLDLKRQIFAEFDASFNVQGGLRGQASTLNEACLVAEVLEPDLGVKTQLLAWYCDLQLREYRNIFRTNQEFAGLDQVSRRYAWLKRVMKTYDEDHSQVFPLSWKMGERFCEKFCEDTKRDITDILVRLGDTVDVKLMLQVLLLTLEFEGKLDRRFGNTGIKDLDAVVAGASAPTSATPGSKFYRIISSAFEPFLNYYINSEDKTIAGMMETYRAKNPVSEYDENLLVLLSSTDLFYFYRQTLVNFSKFSTGKSFADLCKMFGKYLGMYCELLTSKCPKDDRRSFTEDELKTVCLIINTGDYCHSITAQLEEKLKDKADAEFKDSIDFTQEKDAFLNVTTASIRLLVKAVENSIESGFNNMSRVPWSTLKSVGDQSEYVTTIGNAIFQSVVIIRKMLREENAKYFRSFCDRFAESLLNRYYGNIYKCKPLSEIGAEQMLLDIHALKTVLIKMTTMTDDVASPTMSSVPTNTAPALYTKLVSRNVSKIETLLKMVMTPHDPAEAFLTTFGIVFPADARTLVNFQRLVEIKGLKRSEQTALLELFQAKYPNAPTGGISSTTGETTSSNTTTGTSSSTFSAGNMASQLGAAATSFANYSAATASKFGDKIDLPKVNVDKLRRLGNISGIGGSKK